jgi:hypothetical protein
LIRGQAGKKMARPKKSVETTIVRESSETEDTAIQTEETAPKEKIKPDPIVIVAPSLGSLSQVMGSSVDPVVESKPKFRVFDNGVFLEELDEDSNKIDWYLEENKKQLSAWVQELYQEPTDANEIIFMNNGQQTRKYVSYSQYCMQNGYAPQEPRITSWMQFYLEKYDPIAEEEIAVKLKGNLRFSFDIIKPEE